MRLCVGCVVRVKTRRNKIRNDNIRERVGVAPIAEKMVGNGLRWFVHVERSCRLCIKESTSDGGYSVH